MNYLDLFAGIGGFALGAYWAGWRFEKHYFSEIDNYCVELYQKRFPDAVALGDITKIDSTKLPEGNWLITGGFPCQDISIAGKGVGINGERSGLWFEMWRIIRDLRPKYAIIENVGAITFRGLDRVLISLAEIGYDAEWQDIRASDVGAPHKRERIWIVANPRDCTDRADGGQERKENGIQKEHRSPGRGRVFGGAGKNTETMADATEHGNRQRLRGERKGKEINERQDGFSQSQSRTSGQDVADTEGRRGWFGDVRRNRVKRDVNRSQGERTYHRAGTEGNASWKWWETEPTVCMLVDGLPAGLDRYEGRLAIESYKRTEQLKALGNSIVPQIAELLFRQIAKIEEASK